MHRGAELPAEFLTHLAGNARVDVSDPAALRRAWEAWATLYDPNGQEPSPEAFDAYFTRPELPTPLKSWRFAGTVRKSQQAILEAAREVPPDRAGEGLHLVAPPGAGKTLIGLLLAMRTGHTTLALAPTATIRHQWARTARSLAAGTWGEDDPGVSHGAVSEDPHELGDLTALTYQMLSVVGADNPFEELARRRWIDELVDGGRTAADAAAWVAELEETNRKSFRRGIKRRARAIRRDVVREDPERLEEVLHPNARELIDRLADAGIGTIILDECHHLLDHWALVVHCLVNKLRARGITPQLIGLTATLPSVEDGEAYENYTRLLGEVDYELPTPAVVKEGNLAPYRSFAWFVSPTQPELEFIAHHEKRLAELIAETFRGDEGKAFLARVLQAGEGTSTQRLAEAFKTDSVVAEAACRMLSQVAPGDPLVKLFPPSAAVRPDTDQQIRLLARYALTVLLPDPGSASEWARIKSVLVDFGYHLTDRGIRRGRDPIDAILATTVAKDHAVLEVLRLERERTAQVRAVVVCDFAVHGHLRGMQAAERGEGRAGALRCHGILAAAREIADMRPVLVTAQHLRVPRGASEYLAKRLGDLLGEELAAVPVEGLPHVCEIEPAAGSARVLAAVSELMTRGEIGLIVGTRGLLGEGWDCPAVNTLIDLSAVATSASTQQLRGRTLRLDPAWREKVAHNWAITCVIEPSVDVDGLGDVDRLHRKLSMVWGLSLEGSDAVIKGAEHTLSPEHAQMLGDLTHKERKATTARLNQICADTFPARAETYRRWRVGEEYVGLAIPAARISPERRVANPFRSGITFEAFFTVVASLVGIGLYQGLNSYLRGGGSLAAGAITAVCFVALFAYLARKNLRALWQAVKQFALPLTAYKGAALAIAATLARRGEVPEFGASNIHVVAEGEAKRPEGYTVRVVGGTDAEQAAVLDTLRALFEPITSPRFVLEVGVGELGWKRPLSLIAVRVLGHFGYRSRFFGLPRALGRRRDDAQFFAAQWEKLVGPCALHEITSPEDMQILTTARKQFGGGAARVGRREVWA
ncbi:MAG TPA: DEAD/DEAH box helicase family protein [Beutenbergiaceae bacterium]|nr:DEAD/DEAH box helicase family protein [Beutenbergiaceae bacterium]